MQLLTRVWDQAEEIAALLDGYMEALLNRRDLLVDPSPSRHTNTDLLIDDNLPESSMMAPAEGDESLTLNERYGVAQHRE